MTELLDRNKNIVRLMELGEFTLQDIGDMYGVTRERVRQIYHKHTGHGYKQRMINRQEKLQEILSIPAFNCVECGNPEYTPIKQEYKLCRDCRRKYRKQERLPWVLFSCDNCGTKFHPFRNRPKGEESKFCSIKCYMERRWHKPVGFLGKVKRIWQNLL